MTEHPQPPRLQDTTERSALPLPLPEHGSPGEGPVYAGRGEQPTFAAPAEEPAFAAPAEPPSFDAPVDPDAAPDAVAFAAASADEDEPEASTEETDAVPEVDPEAPAPIPDDGHPDLDPVFAPPAAESVGAEAAQGGPAPEVLVGAAFLGGVALAFLIKRFGS